MLRSIEGLPIVEQLSYLVSVVVRDIPREELGIWAGPYRHFKAQALEKIRDHATEA